VSRAEGLRGAGKSPFFEAGPDTGRRVAAAAGMARGQKIEARLTRLLVALSVRDVYLTSRLAPRPSGKTNWHRESGSALPEIAGRRLRTSRRRRPQEEVDRQAQKPPPCGWMDGGRWLARGFPRARCSSPRPVYLLSLHPAVHVASSSAPSSITATPFSTFSLASTFTRFFPFLRPFRFYPSASCHHFFFPALPLYPFPSPCVSPPPALPL